MQGREDVKSAWNTTKIYIDRGGSGSWNTKRWEGDIELRGVIETLRADKGGINCSSILTSWSDIVQDDDTEAVPAWADCLLFWVKACGPLVSAALWPSTLTQDSFWLELVRREVVCCLLPSNRAKAPTKRAKNVVLYLKSQFIDRNRYKNSVGKNNRISSLFLL